MIAIKVKLFAIARESFGSQELDLELEDGATVSDALVAIGSQGDLDLESMVVAVNRSYSGPDTGLRDGDEIAIVPPVSGGAGSDPLVHFALRRETLDSESLVARASASSDSVGAIVVFQGVTRDVERLEYECYEEMVGEMAPVLLEEVAAEHRLAAVVVEHRLGEVPLGEASVVVATASAHRAQAFAAAQELMNRLKAEFPIWKKEHGDEGSHWVAGNLPQTASARLTHADESGRIEMVDVGQKAVTGREATAIAQLKMLPGTAALIEGADLPKGDVIASARLAGIQAAKKTWDLIPLCHQISLSFCEVEITVEAARGEVQVEATVGANDRTGVEMEAMTAAAIAALTIYDMAKGVERGIVVERLALQSKSGGRSGEWKRQ